MKNPDLCNELRCRNRRRRNRKRCATCDGRIRDAANPSYKSYRNLKAHAKTRGIECTITFAEFMLFATETGYLSGKGPHAHHLTIDRRDNELGYVTGNLQVMTRAKNSEKRMKHDAIRMRAGFAWNGGVKPKEEKAQ